MRELSALPKTSPLPLISMRTVKQILPFGDRRTGLGMGYEALMIPSSPRRSDRAAT